MIGKEAINLVTDKLSKDNRTLLYLVVSGSHAWGLDTPTSDIDLRGVYQDPTTKILSLYEGRDNIEFTQDNYDIQLYEVEKFFKMLCKHNGNMVNLLWLPSPLFISFGIPWVGLARNFLTRKLKFYYRGYAEGQRKRAMSERGGKALIYTYREMFSGLYTMRYGHLEFNFMKLWKIAIDNGWYSGHLLDKYFLGPTKEVSDEDWHRFYSEWEDLCIKLDKEAETSPLPETYDGAGECNELLLQLRLYNLYVTK